MSKELKLLLVLLCLLSTKLFATDYYIRPIGSDTNSGVTPNTSWQTLAPLNNTNFLPGDNIFIEGSYTYSGSISFDQLDLGSAGNPITITSFGAGGARATINSDTTFGFFAHNSAGIVIKNLNFTGSGTTSNKKDGILFLSDQSITQLDYVNLDSITVSGYLKSGICFEVNTNATKGFSNVRVTNCISHSNGEAGIRSIGSDIVSSFPNQNFYIAFNTVYNNTGRPEVTNTHTGNGIVISAVNQGIIEHNIAYNNGAQNGRTCGGPVGIWCFASNGITIQFCESYNNKAGKNCDGGGFDINGGVTNSVMQYNYSHDNEGTGFLISQYSGALPFNNNTVRYNISENDGRKNESAGIYVFSSGSNGGIQNANIYNNTIFITPSSIGTPSGIIIDGPISNTSIRNNIIQITGGIPLISAKTTSGVTFQGNCYWTSGSAFRIAWGNTNYSSLSNWSSATNQEKNGGTSTGFQINPQLTSPGNGGTIGNTLLLNTLNAYKLLSSSPMINAGLNLNSLFNINPGTRDFYGNQIPLNSNFDIGANESSFNTICSDNGKILRELWTGITGTSVSNIPVNSPPSSTSQPTIFEGPTNAGTNYGARYRGYVCVPATGNYTFWIASNDNSELWLSTNDNPANKLKIANVPGYTNSRQWDKYTSQKSLPISLVAGQRYYIEALHKQGAGTDNLAVGWQIPNGTFERPIPGNRLSPFGGSTNNPPSVNITSPVNGAAFTAPANITINANASDSDGSINKVEFYQGSTKVGEDNLSPYSFNWVNVGVGNYTLTAKAFDNGGASTTSTAVNISVFNTTTCTASGTILREFWNGVSGNNVSAIPTNLPPTSTGQFTIFEGPINIGTNYGARYRGYVCVPVTGNYTFWIASNDNSELWLSTNDNPANKAKIANVTGYTNSRQWDKYTSQKSLPISLLAGQRYYIEALHKQGAGTDNLAVGWQIPNGTFERPIPGNRLSPFVGSPNNPPSVNITSPANGASFTAPANITINANASDNDGSINKVEFYQGSTKLGEDNLSPYSFSWTNVVEGNYTLTTRAFDNSGASTTSTAVNISVSNLTTCTASGTILREFWNGVSGNNVSSIPTNLPPTSTGQFTIFEGPVNIGTNYGARYRGYVCVPITGNYTFWIASNDNSELWLSTNDNPANKAKIANVTGYTSSRQWDKYTSQKSLPISLVAGQRYYIEALHKQGAGTDNLAVGWQIPNGTFERPIPGNRLSPAEISNIEISVMSLSVAKKDNSEGNESSITVHVYPNPIIKGDLSLTIEGYQKNNYKVLIDILSLQGKSLYSDKVNCDITCPRTIIPIDHTFPRGVYIIKVRIDGQVYTEKLLID